MSALMGTLEALAVFFGSLIVVSIIVILLGQLGGKE